LHIPKLPHLPFIKTARLEIRKLEMHDLEDFHDYRSDPEVARYQGFQTMNMQQAEDFIVLQRENMELWKYGSMGVWTQYGIEDYSSKKLVGDCAIRLLEPDPGVADIGITIAPAFQRRGYAAEAITGILEFLFLTKNIHRVVETVDAENTPAIRLMRSLRFRQEGHFIENIFFKGKWGSEIQFAMLSDEWLKNLDADQS
jgi:[ribosomal protein S5]-alanine N-acetyltransferase